MPGHSLYGKQRICYTEVTDFTEFQGIGVDPLYKRYDSVFSVIKNNLPEKYWDFLAQPLYDDELDQISWFVRDWKESPERFCNLSPEDAAKYSLLREETFSEFKKVLAKLKGEDLQILSGALKNADGNDFLFCYDDKVSVVAWGMMPDTKAHTVYGTIIHGFDFQKKHKIRFDAGSNGSFKTKLDGQMTRVDGSILTERDLPSIPIADDGYVFKHWDPDPIGLKVTRDLTFTAKYEKVFVSDTDVEKPTVEKISIRFEPGEHGTITGNTQIFINKGGLIDGNDIPHVNPEEGYRFIGWDKETNGFFESDEVFTALFEAKDIACTFDPGDFGTLSGLSKFNIPAGTAIPTDKIPEIIPKKGYKFIGWNISPINAVLNRDTVFQAQYEKEERIPWYKRLWMLFTGKGCLKWLLWLLLLLLLIFLLSNLLHFCDRDYSEIIPVIGQDDVLPAERIETGDGRVIDDNGPIRDIIGDDGTLPDDNVVAPIVGDDGSMPPIIENPGAPSIISNRLNIYFEDENTDLNGFASEFKRLYPGNDYKIIGVDENVKMLQIQIPESRRDFIRDNLNAQMPNYDFFVVDESIMTLGSNGESQLPEDFGWHLSAINLKKGWEITKGSRNITVAIVDDGFDVGHDILKGRIVDAYNVFTQDNHLGLGEGHGTHVAGLAIGSDQQVDKGVSGVAPKCKFMPVQVFDNGVCTFSSLTSGIMYAIHQGADVVNVSIGPDFNGLGELPKEIQEVIAETQFKNEEKVWRKIIATANSKNVILVLATGNSSILACVPPECRTNNTINVAAVDKNFTVTSFSNYGNGSNISAPGKDIASSFPENSYCMMDGTSMAAPIVTGTVALMKSMNKDIPINEVLSILQQSGKSVSGDISPMVQIDRALIMQRDGCIAPINSGEQIDPSSPEAQQTDYDEIRKMIQEYKDKISELERMLPENNR